MSFYGHQILGKQTTLVRLIIDDLPAGFHIDAVRFEAVLADGSRTAAWLNAAGLRVLLGATQATIDELEKRRVAANAA